MKKPLIILSMAFFFYSATFSQTTYHTAVGIRLGTGYSDLISVSLKTFLSDGPGALEFNLGVKPATYYTTGCCTLENGNLTMISFSASYQYHVPISGSTGPSMVCWWGIYIEQYVFR